MEKPILTIRTKKYCGESAVVSVRVPKTLLRDMDAAAEQTGRSRNELISTCLEFALDHMEIMDQEKQAAERLLQD
ncbi:MAG: ribbon-helix-helix domain-containing protein [Clostridia bacterium]|nr:ribbon-helix-helix domain-containing protein [Clostridia bacterium]